MVFRLRMLMAFVLAMATVQPVRAEQFWMAYEGNDLPENEGWVRHFGNDEGPGEGDGAHRSINDGALHMDSLFDPSVYDYARTDRGVALAPGEYLCVEWRMRVGPETDDRDAEIVLGLNSPPGMVVLSASPDGLTSVWEDARIALDLTQYHAFRLVSTDLLTYELSVNGSLSQTGSFEAFFEISSFFAFGDATRGRRSESDWDYVRYGVIPEPGTLVLASSLVFIGLLARIKRT